MISVEQWAEIRRMKFVEGKSIKGIVRETGIARNTVRSALRSDQPPSFCCPARGSKLDPFRDKIEELLDKDPELSGVRIGEEIAALGYEGGKTILDELLRELRPRFAPPRSFQRTTYRPGELIQLDLCELRAEVPVGWGQTRRGYLLTAKAPWSRAFAATLIFSKRFADIAHGMNRNLARLGALPQKLVWDREGAIAPRGRPTDPFLAYCGQLALGWVILAAGDAQAKGALEREHRFIHGNFEAGRSFANPLDLQLQLDQWTARQAQRIHRTTRQRPAERLQVEREQMRALPEAMPPTEERWVMRVPPQPYVRFDRNDYSLDPRLVGRRVELRASQAEIRATCLDSGELAARHARVFTRGLDFTDPAHQAELDRLRGERRAGPGAEVELRPLADYDRLIPA